MAENVKCPICGSPATLEESGWCFCANAECLCAWSVMCTDKIAAVTATRDALKHALERLEAFQRADHTAAQYADARRDALAAQLAALKKRVADAPRRRFRADSIEAPQRMAMFALVRLEDGE